ncbi:MAG: response regulator [Verrucomicrobiota bacterium]
MMSSTILLAEDNDDDAFLMTRAFRKAHLLNPLVRVKGGEEAVVYLRGEGEYADRQKFPIPFLLLLDLNMPRMNGFAVLEWARTQPQLKHMLIVILTSSTSEADINKAYKLGANSYLSKPGGFEELVQLLTRLHGYWLLTGNPSTRTEKMEFAEQIP